MTARIEPLRGRDAGEVGELLAASHHTYPAYQALWPNPRVRARVLRSYLTSVARDAAGWGGAVIAKEGTNAVGAALWLPPGAFPLSAARRTRMAPTMLRIATGGPLRAAWFGLLGARLAGGSWAEPIWYLRSLGVRPEARRRGVGALLLAPVLARADEEGAHCRLDLSDQASAPYFQRHGFLPSGREVPVCRRSADVSATGVSASYLGMVRPPR